MTINKLKKIILAVLLVCLTVCLGVAVAACDNGDTPPDIIPPDGGHETPPEEDPNNNNGFTLTVKSRGGYVLNGVSVTLTKDGESKGNYQSVDGGKITCNLEMGEYTVEVDENSLPAGYFVPVGTTYKTSATDKNTDIIVDSEVINSAAPANTVYKTGDVMYNFSFTDVDGVTYDLAETLKTKKAVVLSFWGTTCSPCVGELPAIQSAYNTYSDRLEIFALSSYGGDSEARIRAFKERAATSATSPIVYTFPMALDTLPGTYVYTKFGVEAYPTTAIIDRYGVVATIFSSGKPSEGYWKDLFNKYTSDNYTIDPTPGNNGDDETFEWVKPSSQEMPNTSAEVAAAIANDTDKINFHHDAEDENSWPWQLTEVNGEKVLAASNTKKTYTYATVFIEVSLKAGDGISFEYLINTKSESNNLFILIDRQLYNYTSLSSGGWHKENLYIANRSVKLEIALMYQRADQLENETPCYIKNINIYDASQDGTTRDLAYSVVESSTLTNDGKYDLDIFEKDGLYYVNYTDAQGKARCSILYADILEVTPWTEIHYGKNTFDAEHDGGVYNYKASLYLFSFWKFSNINDSSEDEFITTKIKYDPEDYIMTNYYLQQFSTNGYVPVTPQLVASINAFIDAMYDEGVVTGDRYEDEWLEFCYYITHWGPDHKNCSESVNPVAGLTFEFAYSATEYDAEKPDETTNKVDVTTILNLTLAGHLEEAGGGVKFTFVPDKTGVYLFESLNASGETDPSIYIYDSLKKHYAQQEDSLKYDHFEGKDVVRDFYLYVEMEAGKTYYITATLHNVGTTGTYDMTIKYVGTYAQYLRVCTTADGMWIPTVGADGTIDYNNSYYGAINAAINSSTGYYHALNRDYSFGSTIYIDFIHGNYYSEDFGLVVRYYTLEELIDRNRFKDLNGNDYTKKMREYYEKAIDKDEKDELYGMIEADEDIVNIISEFLSKAYQDKPDTGAWMMFANYYQSFGTPEA